MTDPADPNAPADEPNLYKHTLQTVYSSTVPNARHTVYDGYGSPTDGICTSLSAGWQCTASDAFVADLKGATSGIVAAFDEAVILVQHDFNAQPDTVPANDYRGVAWPRNWNMWRRNL